MLTMDQIHHIRHLFYEQGRNLTEIASETGLNWKTVKKYVDMEDFNGPPPTPASEVIHESNDLRSVSEMLGHSDISTTQMYLNLNLGKMRDVYAKAHPRG